MGGKISVILTTFPDADSAAAAAEILVAEHLAACVQYSGETNSVYFWEGRICKDGEVAVSIKTSVPVPEGLFARFCQLHPYKCPQWIAAEATASPEYAAWVGSVCAANAQYPAPKKPRK